MKKTILMAGMLSMSMATAAMADTTQSGATPSTPSGMNSGTMGTTGSMGGTQPMTGSAMTGSMGAQGSMGGAAPSAGSMGAPGSMNSNSMGSASNSMGTPPATPTTNSAMTGTTGSMPPRAQVSATAPGVPSIQTNQTTTPNSLTGAVAGTSATPLKGANSFTQKQAMRRLEKNGYTNVSGLAKDDQSVWRGTAMKNGQSMNVALDYKGHISAQPASSSSATVTQ